MADFPITLLTTDAGCDVDIALAPNKKGYTFRVIDPGNEDDEPVLTAAEWARVAIQLLVKCPDAIDVIGLCSATSDGLSVCGRTVSKRGKWEAHLTDYGSDQNGRTLLGWSSSRPLALWEIGAAFKAMIEQLSEMDRDLD